MKLPSTYIDMFNLVHNASDKTNIQLGKPEELLTGFFSKANVPPLPYFLFYILDFIEKKYLAVGPGTETFLGHTTNYLKDGGPLGYYDLWHQNDWATYNKEVFADHAKTLGQSEIINYKNLLIRSNYRLKAKDGNYLTLAQQSSYIDVSPEGIPLAVIGVVSDITPYKQDTRMTYNITAFGGEGKSSNKVLLNKFYFPDAHEGILGKREIEVLKWICDGLTTKEIADKLSISIYTVNNHRVNILQKTNCKNFAEVLKFAITNGII